MITYCFKLYRAKRNKKLHKQINAAGIIYNHCIALHKRYYRLYGKSLNACKLKNHLARLKKFKKFAYLKEIGSQAVQDVAERIDKAYKLFWRNLKHKIRTAPPSFKKVRKYKSFTLKQAGWKLLDCNTLQIGKQKYRYFKSREIEGKIKTVTIKRDAPGDLYVYFVCEREENQNQVMVRTGKSVGYDFGLKTFLTASDENDIISPLFFKNNAKAIAKANRKLSKKKRGSNNRARARLELARLHKRVANKRKDFHWKTAHKIASEYALISIEDLNLKAMQKRFGKKISDLGFSEFVKILEYVAYKSAAKVVKIDRFYPSSQLCSVCGFQNSETKDLSVREWTCPHCQTVHSRDRNAAINIQREGEKSLLA